MEIQFVALPAMFVFRQRYERSKGRAVGSVVHDEWIEKYEPGCRITITHETRSLLGIRWKTPQGQRFETDEINDLIRSGVIEPVPN